MPAHRHRISCTATYTYFPYRTASWRCHAQPVPPCCWWCCSPAAPLRASTRSMTMTGRPLGYARSHPADLYQKAVSPPCAGHACCMDMAQSCNQASDRIGSANGNLEGDHLVPDATAVAASTMTTTARAPGATQCRASRSTMTTGRRTPRRSTRPGAARTPLRTAAPAVRCDACGHVKRRNSDIGSCHRRACCCGTECCFPSLPVILNSCSITYRHEGQTHKTYV